MRAHSFAASFILMLGLVVPVCAGEEPLISGNGYHGVIIPVQWAEANSSLTKRFTGFWLPSTNDIAAAEAAVAKYIATAGPDARLGGYTQRQVAVIQKNLTAYRRRYVGITVGGEKRIFFNVLTPDETKHSRWRSKYVHLVEGGPDCWKIQYVPATKQCLEFNASFGY